MEVRRGEKNTKTMAAHGIGSSTTSSNHIHDGPQNQATISVQSEDEDREVDGDIVGHFQ